MINQLNCLQQLNSFSQKYKQETPYFRANIETKANTYDKQKGKTPDVTKLGIGFGVVILSIGTALILSKGRIISKLFPRFKPRNPIEQCIKEVENITFDTPNLRLMKDFYGDKTKYDLGLRYAIVASNTKKIKGTGVIVEKLPEMFEGLNKDELFKVLDNLRLQNLPWKENQIYTFKVGEKSFDVSFVGVGCVNNVYKITDSEGRAVCYRYTSFPKQSKLGHGMANEVATTIEANKAGVTDVKKLYMANILSEDVIKENSLKYTGGWSIEEFIDGSKMPPKDGLKLTEWLKSKGLKHNDLVGHESNRKNGFIIDMGGIIPDVAENPYSHLINVEMGELQKYLK